MHRHVQSKTKCIQSLRELLEIFLNVENMDIQYAQSGIFTPSDFEFARDGVAAECNPNLETVVVADVDLEILRRQRKSGTVRQLRDRRRDLYEIRYKN